MSKHVQVLLVLFMAVVSFVLAAIGWAMLDISTSAIHELSAQLWFLSASVFFTGALLMLSVFHVGARITGAIKNAGGRTR